MRLTAEILIGVLAVAHVWFLILEMFLWSTPFGRKTFGMTAEQAGQTATLAANQGLYNGFLAAGLVCGLIAHDPTGLAFKVFFLVCVLVAGLFGGVTVSRRIFAFQAAPAALGLVALFFAPR